MPPPFQASQTPSGDVCNLDSRCIIPVCDAVDAPKWWKCPTDHASKGKSLRPTLVSATTDTLAWTRLVRGATQAQRSASRLFPIKEPSSTTIGCCDRNGFVVAKAFLLRLLRVTQSDPRCARRHTLRLRRPLVPPGGETRSWWLTSSFRLPPESTNPPASRACFE